MTLRFPKVLFLVIVLIICLFIIGFLIILNLPQAKEEPTDITPTPTSVSGGKIRQGTSSIKPQAINPPENTSGSTIQNPSQNITYTLSEQVTPTEIQVEVSPYLPVKVRQGNRPTDIVVYPDPPQFWKPDVLYTVTLIDQSGEEITSYQIKVPKLRVPEVVD